MIAIIFLQDWVQGNLRIKANTRIVIDRETAAYLVREKFAAYGEPEKSVAEIPEKR